MTSLSAGSMHRFTTGCSLPLLASVIPSGKWFPQWVNSVPVSITKCLGNSLLKREEASLMVQAQNTSGSEVRDNHMDHCKVKASLGYIARPCLKFKKKKKRERRERELGEPWEVV